MTLLQTSVRLRRVTLAQAVRTLAPEDLRVALHLLLGACPSTGRTWTTVTRIAEDLGIDLLRADLAIHRLVDDAFVTLWSERGPLRCYEFGNLLLRNETTPDNLPVEPLP